MEYEVKEDIRAPAETIWEIITDAPAYSGWDSGVERIEGRIAPGEKIKVFSELNPGRGFPIKVTEFEPARRMTWTGGMPLGLFKGVRTFTLTPGPDSTTRFEMRETFSGPLLPLMRRSMPDFGPSFKQYGAGLRTLAESRTGPG
jgi:hypothetical protein